MIGCCPVVLQSRFNSQEQFKVLHDRYPLVNNSTKGLLLSTYLKMLLADPSNSGLQSDIIGVLTKCSHQMDPDLQQRSAEYLVGLLQDSTGAPAANNLRHLEACCHPSCMSGAWVLLVRPGQIFSHC
jgi:hypothetical protein